MALRVRNAVTNKANEENKITIGKSKIGTSTVGLTRRAALGEISNALPRDVNVNKDGSKKPEFKKLSTVTEGIKKVSSIAPRQTTSRFVQQTKQSLVCKTGTLAKPTRSLIKSSTLTTSTVAAVGPPTALSKPRIRPLLKTSSYNQSERLLPKPAPVCSQIVVPKIPENSRFDDIDRDCANNPILLGEYAPEIFAFLRDMEKKFMVKDNFLEGQQVTSKMRAIVIDWLVDVQLQYNLLIETLHLSVGIFDRFLNIHRTITKGNLQLVGVTSMWIACKYEELFSPELDNFVYITDRAYDKDEILKMEQLIHKTLNFSYGQPLSIHFLRRYSNASKAGTKHHSYGKYFLELSLISYQLRSVKPSLIAAVALYIAFCVVEGLEPVKDIWTEGLAFYSTYSFDDLKPHLPVLAKIILDTKISKLQAVSKKYSSSKHHNVSINVHLKEKVLEKIAALEVEDHKTTSGGASV